MKCLTAALSLSLAAALLAPSGASAQQPIYPAKVAPVSLSSSVTPKRDRSRPYKFVTRGTLRLPAVLPFICPPGITVIQYCVPPPKPLVCVGSVTVKFKKGLATRSTRIVSLRSNCTYSSNVTFRNRSTRGTLRVTVRFNGNAFLTARSATTKTVRAG